MSKAQMNSDPDRCQTTPVGDADALTRWWGWKPKPFTALKVRVLEAVTPGGEIAFELEGDKARVDYPGRRFTVKLDRLDYVWPILPSTAQLVKNPGTGPSYAFLFLSDAWARSEGIRALRVYAEDGGSGGGKYPLGTGVTGKKAAKTARKSRPAIKSKRRVAARKTAARRSKQKR